MQKEKIIKDDGRYLIFYRFDDEEDAPAEKTGGSSQKNTPDSAEKKPGAKGCAPCQS